MNDQIHKASEGNSSCSVKVYGNEFLSRTQCNMLRGVAILGIFLHNYCHWLNPVVKENEYTFTQYNVDRFTQAMLHPDVLFPLHILSFFGHYGVPVFLFLSAYGLARKYENASSVPSQSVTESRLAAFGEATGGLNFIVFHFLKLFKMMLIGFVLFTMVDALIPPSFHYKFINIIAQLGMFNNLLPEPDRIIWPGPYWFFGLMLQLYVVYRLLMYRRHWSVTVMLIVCCWLVQAFCDPEGEIINRIRYNFVGGMLPFGAGYLYARYGRVCSKPAYAAVLLLSTVAVVVFSYNFQAWFFVPLFVCFGSIAMVKLLPERGTAVSWLAWMGSLSAALFVCHPVIRKIFIPYSRRGDVYTGLLLYVIASIAVAWVVRELMKRIPDMHLK